MYLGRRVQAPVALSRYDGAPLGGVGREEGEQLGGLKGGGSQEVVYRRVEVQLVELNEARLSVHGGEEGGEGSVKGSGEGLFNQSDALVNLRRARNSESAGCERRRMVECALPKW